MCSHYRYCIIFLTHAFSLFDFSFSPDFTILVVVIDINFLHILFVRLITHTYMRKRRLQNRVTYSFLLCLVYLLINICIKKRNVRTGNIKTDYYNTISRTNYLLTLSFQRYNYSILTFYSRLLEGRS